MNFSSTFSHIPPQKSFPQEKLVLSADDRLTIRWVSACTIADHLQTNYRPGTEQILSATEGDAIFVRSWSDAGPNVV